MTENQKLIASKWFLSLEILSKRTGVGVYTLSKVARGEKAGYYTERKLRAYLENYKGEI